MIEFILPFEATIHFSSVGAYAKLENTLYNVYESDIFESEKEAVKMMFRKIKLMHASRNEKYNVAHGNKIAWKIKSQSIVNELFHKYSLKHPELFI